ncbi:MAG: GNAT family N-acetyltransferase [Acidobacteria bacterium]|nr:GNAT family N-acetyltransferase [Acidobacteriota bacterium]
MGILPLVKRGNTIRFLGTPQADYGDIICEESRAAEVLTVALEALQSSSNAWKECVLQHLAKHSRIVRHYKGLPAKLRGRLCVVPTDRYPTIVVRGKPREEVFAKFLVKHHTRRRRSKLHKAGLLEFRYLETAPEARKHLCDFFRHHVRRKMMMGRRSSCESSEFRHFLLALVEEIGLRKAFRFGVLELDSRPLAWAIGFQVNGKFLLYQHTFDLNVWDNSPGEVLMWHLLEYASKNVTREFDFGKGEEAYKKRFTNYARETFSLFLEPPNIAGEVRGRLRKATGYVHVATRSLKRTIQEHRPVLHIFRSCQGWLMQAATGVRHAWRRGELLKTVIDLPGSRGTTYLLGEGGVTERNIRRPAAGCDSGASISVGHLGDLVSLALESPLVLARSELPRCRQRLKHGDRVYIVRENSKVTLLCWLAIKASANARQCTQGSAVDSDRSALLLYECTSFSPSSASFRQLLSVLISEASTKKAELMVKCRTDQLVFRYELQRQGFLRSKRTQCSSRYASR